MRKFPLHFCVLQPATPEAAKRATREQCVEGDGDLQRVLRTLAAGAPLVENSCSRGIPPMRDPELEVRSLDPVGGPARSRPRLGQVLKAFNTCDDAAKVRDRWRRSIVSTSSTAARRGRVRRQDLARRPQLQPALSLHRLGAARLEHPERGAAHARWDTPSDSTIVGVIKRQGDHVDQHRWRAPAEELRQRRRAAGRSPTPRRALILYHAERTRGPPRARPAEGRTSRHLLRTRRRSRPSRRTPPASFGVFRETTLRRGGGSGSWAPDHPA